MKKKIILIALVCIILLITVPLIVKGSNEKQKFLTLAPENEVQQRIADEFAKQQEEEQQSQSMQTQSIESSENLTEHEQELLKETEKNDEELKQRQQQYREIMTKYNGENYTKLAQELQIELERPTIRKGGEISEVEKQLNKMKLDTYENENLTTEEKEILLESLKDSYSHFTEESGIKERYDKIMDEAGVSNEQENYEVHILN